MTRRGRPRRVSLPNTVTQCRGVGGACLITVNIPCVRYISGAAQLNFEKIKFGNCDSNVEYGGKQIPMVYLLISLINPSLVYVSTRSKQENNVELLI